MDKCNEKASTNKPYSTEFDSLYKSQVMSLCLTNSASRKEILFKYQYPQFYFKNPKYI